MTLDRIQTGIKGIVTRVGGEGPLRLRLLDMGISPGTEIMVYKKAPMGDPIEIHLRGYSLTILKSEAANIEVNINAKGGKSL